MQRKGLWGRQADSISLDLDQLLETSHQLKALFKAIEGDMAIALRPMGYFVYRTSSEKWACKTLLEIAGRFSAWAYDYRSLLQCEFRQSRLDDEYKLLIQKLPIDLSFDKSFRDRLEDERLDIINFISEYCNPKESQRDLGTNDGDTAASTTEKAPKPAKNRGKAGRKPISKATQNSEEKQVWGLHDTQGKSAAIIASDLFKDIGKQEYVQQIINRVRTRKKRIEKRKKPNVSTDS